jgi:short-subunit dehydrogenase
MPKAILVGASSGIGKDLAVVLAERGYELGLVARRVDLLQALKSELKTKVYIAKMDVEQAIEARQALADLIAEMGGCDVLIYNAGIGESSGRWEKENQVLQVNAVGFAALCNYIFRYWKESKQAGHIVGITSIAGVRGSRMAIGYSATKAFMSNYMEGLRNEAVKKEPSLSPSADIRPGFVETPMTKGQKGMFWVAPPRPRLPRRLPMPLSAKPRRPTSPSVGDFAAWVMKNLPDFIWNKQ